MSNPNDRIRDIILRKLYEIHKSARSPKTTGVGIKDLQSSLKEVGLKQQEVASNLDYLVQKKWVVERIEERTYTTSEGTTHPSDKMTYKISHVGIDKLEEASIYEYKPFESRINITNIEGVTVVGDGNIVNTEYGDAQKALNEIRQAIFKSEEINDENKLNIISDIHSLQAQLQKPVLNKDVTQSLLSSIKEKVTLPGLVEAIKKVGVLLGFIP